MKSAHEKPGSDLQEKGAAAVETAAIDLSAVYDPDSNGSKAYLKSAYLNEVAAEIINEDLYHRHPALSEWE